MKYSILLLTMLFTMPLLSAEDIKYTVSGIWQDRYGDEKLDIYQSDYGLEVRKKGLFRKTRTFQEFEYNYFSDSDGNSIEFLSSTKLLWKNRNNRTAKTFYAEGYTPYDNRSQYGYDRYDSRSNYNSGYNRQSQRGGRYNGAWVCSAGKRNISIRGYNNGFKVKHWNNNRWDTYRRDPNNSRVFRSSYGDRYIYKNNNLVWYGRNGCDTIRFRRR